MILVDTNIWADHIRHNVSALATLTTDRLALVHPFVLGEIALGSLRDRDAWLTRLDLMPQAPVARPVAVRALIEQQRLYGTGVGYIDAHLLASALILPGTSIWTRDKALRAHAERLGIAYPA